MPYDNHDPAVLVARAVTLIAQSLERMERHTALLTRLLPLAWGMAGLILLGLGFVLYHTLALRQESQALLQGLTEVLRRVP
jgi:hypothetical protein